MQKLLHVEFEICTIVPPWIWLTWYYFFIWYLSPALPWERVPPRFGFHLTFPLNWFDSKLITVYMILKQFWVVGLLRFDLVSLLKTSTKIFCIVSTKFCFEKVEKYGVQYSIFLISSANLVASNLFASGQYRSCVCKYICQARSW